MGIIAANAAAIKPLFSRSKWLRSTRTPFTDDCETGDFFQPSHAYTNPSHSAAAAGHKKNKSATFNSSEEDIVTSPGHAVTPCSSGELGGRHETRRPPSQLSSERKPSKKESFTGIVVTTTFQVE